MRKEKRNRKAFNYLIGLAVPLAGSCVSPTAQDPALPSGWEQTIASEWAICQRTLDCLGYPEALSVSPESFEWVVQPEAFVCGGELANGCFSPDGKLIQFNSQTPTVIRHECGHAILYVLKKRPLYKCYEHGQDAPEFCPRSVAFPWESCPYEE